jgi:hypothetical protein
MPENVTGLVLSSAASDEPQSIPGLPGLWATTPELSVVPADHGFDLADLTAQAQALGFEVEEIEWEREIQAAEDDEGNALLVSEIKAAIAEGSYSDDELRELLHDERVTVVKAAQAALAHDEPAVDDEPGEDD